MDRYVENVKKLLECIPNWAEEINELRSIEWTDKIFEKDNRLYRKENQTEFQLTSRNVDAEMELYTSEIDWKKEHLVLVLGLGNIELIKRLVKANFEVLVYEPNKEVVKYFMDNFDLAQICVPSKFVLWWGEELPEQCENRVWELVYMNWNKNAYTIQVIMNPGYAMYTKHMHKLVSAITKCFYKSFVNLGNELLDVIKGLRCNYMNFDSALEGNSIIELGDAYKDKPAIIVASGPSLEKNIHHLKKAQGKALIFSCDASLEACKQQGVKPDAIFSIERIRATYLNYYEGKEFDEELVLIAPSLVNSDILREYKGKKIILSKTDSGVDGWWKQFFPNMEHFPMGMSCATLAAATAERLGCKPIILIGQDLAYTDNKIHSDSTHGKYQGENCLPQKRLLEVEDVYGNRIYTDEIYNLFRYYYETRIGSNPELQIIDATEGGAKIEGSEIMTFEDAIAQYCTEDMPGNLYSHLEDIEVTPDMIRSTYDKIVESVKQIRENLIIAKEMAEEHYAYLEEVYEDDLEAKTEKQLVEIVKKMEKANDIVVFLKEHDETITFFDQYIAQTVAHVKALGNELSAENVMKNLMLQGNLMGAVKRTCAMLDEEYEKMLIYMEEHWGTIGR